MLVTTRAIVLNKTKYGDKRLIVSMFTRDYGMMSFSSTLSRRKGLKINYFQPLTILETSFDLRATVRIHALRTIRLAEPQKSIPFDARKLAATLFLADCLRFALREELSDEALFDYVARSIEWLDSATGNFANFHIIFLIKLTAYLGFFPNARANESPKHLRDRVQPRIDKVNVNKKEKAWFDLDEGCFTQMPPAPDAAIAPEQAALIPLLTRLNFRTMRLLRLSRDERNAITEKLLDYLARHIPGFPHLRSFDILKELFD
ncbi:MAG: DNA repair protein RecO C-terminal domain-containing protein [Prevotella sp.]|nr:DNA repair protein RecO C-terminal domain-containing protein [Prevotella sp.]MCD8305242.1 DNA repair protein RecO C-terminal domain-containing protein [Prevotella sp.]